MLYNYVLFDLDGTLVDSGERITKSVAFALSHFGIANQSRAELNRFIGPPLIDSFMRFYGFSREKAGEAVDIYRSRYRVKGVYENVVYPGIPELLAGLKNAGAKLAVATSKPEVFAKIVLEDVGLAGYFEVIAGAELDDAEGRKRKLRSEKAEVIAYALELLGSPEGGILMVGDRKHDIIGAKAMGLPCAAVLFGYGSREEFEEAGADYIAETPAEVLDICLGKGTGNGAE